MSARDIEHIRKEELTLKKEIKDIDDNILYNLDEPDEINQWTLMKEAKQVSLDSLINKREKIQNQIKNNFINNKVRRKVFSNKKGNNNENRQKRNEIYEKAKEDVINTVYNILICSPEDIARVFSNQDFQIEPIPESNVNVTVEKYEWYDYLGGSFMSRVIPLSPGIEQPKYFCKKKQTMLDKHFVLNSIYADSNLQQRVKNYFKKFNINFEFRSEKEIKNIRGKNISRQTFFFTMTPIDGYIYFP